MKIKKNIIGKNKIKISISALAIAMVASAAYAQKLLP